MEHDVTAHAAELVEQTGGRNDGIVVDFYLAGKLRRVSDDAAIANNAVVSYVHVFHQQVTTAYDGLALRGGATADSYIFADGVVVANLTSSLLALELQILRFRTDRGTGEELVSIADAGTKVYSNIVEELVVVTNDNILVYYAEGTNNIAVAQFSFGVYNC